MSIAISQLKTKISLLKKIIGLYQQIISLFIRRTIIIIHWSATPRDRTLFEAIERNHRMRGYTKSKLEYHCGYNRVIIGNGKEYKARGDFEQNFGCSAYKGLSIDICLTLMPGEIPSEAQLAQLKKDLDLFKFRGIVKIQGHNYFDRTACPGPYLTNWIKQYKKGLIN